MKRRRLGMTKDKSESTVLGDIGGTNARFAVLQDGALSDVEHIKVSEYQQFADALDAFLKRCPAGRSIHHAIFGVAGVVERERCALTNNPWIVAADELRARFNFSTIHIVNDFEALAWSLPHLTAKDLRLIGGRKPNVAAPMVVVGPGTGLGVAAYVHGERGDFVLGSEGGHATLPSASSREDAIIAKLRTQFGHVSAERVLSGPGLENLYRVIASLVLGPSRNALQPKLPRRRSQTVARSAGPLLILFAGCWAAWPETSRLASARRAACTSPAALRHSYAIIYRNPNFAPALRPKDA